MTYRVENQVPAFTFLKRPADLLLNSNSPGPGTTARRRLSYKSRRARNQEIAPELKTAWQDLRKRSAQPVRGIELDSPSIRSKVRRKFGRAASGGCMARLAPLRLSGGLIQKPGQWSS